MVFIYNKMFGPSPQAEAKWRNLTSIATAEFAYFAERGEKHWGKTFEEIGWSPTGRTIYVYFLTPTEYIYNGKSPGKPGEHTGRWKTPEELGLVFPINFAKYNCPVPGVSAKGFTAVAIGNIDNDETLDVWWINNEKTLINSQNDLKH
jgi:hypothetical protein